MEETEKSIYTITLNNLKKNYLFKLSLGSKELFHSNFLEMLWELNQEQFVCLLRQLSGNENLLPHIGESKTLYDDNGETYQVDYYALSREKENFDICIYHLDQQQYKNGNYQKPKEVYDLIIENKVKSVPHKVQLEEYCDKVSKKNSSVSGCTFILLSLMESFTEKNLINTPDPDDPNWTPWKIKNYSELRDAIKKCYPENDNNFGEYEEIISKYLDFIENLHELQGKIKQNFDSAPLFDEKTIGEFKKYRLHDLYIKQLCGLFVDKLKEELNKKDWKNYVKIDLWSKYSSKKVREISNRKEILILLHEEMLQGAGSVGVTICPVWEDTDTNKDFYEIIIQNGQYRHCLNRAENEETKDAQALWDAVKCKSFMEPISIKKCPKWSEGTKEYCTYKDRTNGDLYVYKYLKIDEDLKSAKGEKYSAKELASIMCQDICELIKSF